MVGFGARLKELREKKTMTQAQIANRLGVAPNSISAYESGIRFPTYDNLVKLARIFHVTTDYLLGLEKRNTVDISTLDEEEVQFVVELVSLLSRK